jgi:hypothetical protein
MDLPPRKTIRGHVGVTDQGSSVRHYVFRSLPTQYQRLRRLRTAYRERRPNCGEFRDRSTGPTRGNTKELNYHKGEYQPFWGVLIDLIIELLGLSIK